MDNVQCIMCRCGDWEEFGADQPRTDCQSFTWKRNYVDGTAKYQCPTCGKYVRSKIVPR